MTLEELATLKANGEFHHATYRNQGTLWEGLWIYRRDVNGFRGYVSAGRFDKDHADLETAYQLCAGSGVSVGAYGQG